MSEMKMSDVFDNDVRHFGGGSIGDDRCDEFALAQFEDSTEAEYACHAINNHDRLNEENQKLREMLSVMTAFYGSSLKDEGIEPASCNNYVEAKQLLEQTK